MRVLFIRLRILEVGNGSRGASLDGTNIYFFHGIATANLPKI